MSLLQAEPAVEAHPAARPRWLRWPGRVPGRTLFVQRESAWSYGRGEEPPRTFVPLSGWAPAHAGGSVRVVLSGLLTHQLVLSDAALPIEDGEAMMAWARHQFVHYHGAVAERWAISTWLNRTQRGASAAHGIDLDGLVRAAGAAQVRLRAVHPWWAVALQAATLEAPQLARDPHAELWLVEGGHVTRVVCGGARVQQIEQHWLERPDGAALAALITACAADRPFVLGYGLHDGDPATLPARCLGTLEASCPDVRWLGA